MSNDTLHVSSNVELQGQLWPAVEQLPRRRAHASPMSQVSQRDYDSPWRSARAEIFIRGRNRQRSYSLHKQTGLL